MGGNRDNQNVHVIGIDKEKRNVSNTNQGAPNAILTIIACHRVFTDLEHEVEAVVIEEA